jgi:hypothetical protein
MRLAVLSCRAAAAPCSYLEARDALDRITYGDGLK